MNIIFQENEKGIIIPLFKNSIQKKDVILFINFIYSSKITDIIPLLINIIKENFEIGQILLDIHNLYNIEKGLLNILIEKFILKKNDDKENKLLYDFFEFISNPFQIEKNIYNCIYRIIGKIFPDFKENVEKNMEIMSKCIDLLNIFYNKKLNTNFEIYDNFFYLYDNEIKTNIKKENNLKINNCIFIETYFFINQNNKNADSIIVKIKFSNESQLIIHLVNNIKIEISYIVSTKIKYKIDNFCELKKWNNIQLKISNESNNKNALIIINNKENEIDLNKEINSITELIFFSKFHGLISPIIISENPLEKHDYFSKEFLSLLYKYDIKIDEPEEKGKIIFKKDKQQYINEKNNNNQNNISLILFLKNNSNENIKEIIPLINKEKNNIPNFYSFNDLNMKENIFLLGGTNNILPLFEIIKLAHKENINIDNVFHKISQLVMIIFNSENNIKEAYYSNTFEILSQFVLNFYKSGKFLTQISKILEGIINKNIFQDIIFYYFKDILLSNYFIFNLSSQGKQIYIKFISFLIRYKINAFDFLITIIEKNEINDEEFLNGVFFFFYQILNSEEHYKKINDLIIILENKDISLIVKQKMLKLLINLINIEIPKEMKSTFLSIQKKKIEKTLNPNEYIKLDEFDNLSKKKINVEFYRMNFINLMEKTLVNEIKIDNLEMEKNLEFKFNLISYLCDNKLISYFIEFSEINDPIIKLDLIYFFQIFICYYIQIYYKKNLSQKELINIHDINGKNYNDYVSKLKIFSILNENNNNNSDFNNKIFKTNLFEKIIHDFIDFVNIIIQFECNENEIKNLNNFGFEILLFLKNFFALIRNNNFLICYDEEFGKKKKIDFSNIYYSRYFIVTLISILHHIFLLKEKENHNLIIEIQKQIEYIILDIYFDGIKFGPICFLEILDQFDWYVYDHKEEITLDFINYFFQIFIKEIPPVRKTSSDINFFNEYINQLFNYKSFSLIDLYYRFYKSENKSKIIISILNSLKLQNLDYFFLNNFLIFFEILTNQPNNLSFYLNEYVSFIVFCFLLYENDINPYLSKSGKKYFFIGLVILSIKSIFLKIYSTKNIDDDFYLVISVLMKMIYNSLNQNPENKLYKYLEEKYGKNNTVLTYFKSFKSIFQKNNVTMTKKNAKNIVFSLKNEFLNLFRKTEFLKPNKYFKFQNILIKMSEKNKEIPLKNEDLKILDSMLDKFQIEKNYKQIKKNLFSWNNSYSDLNLFYSEKGKRHLCFKILNHYSEELSLPFLKPILNFKIFPLIEFNKFFDRGTKKQKIMENDFINEDFNILLEDLLDENKRINGEGNKKLIDFFQLKENNIYDCCLIKLETHIQGFMINKGNRIIFIGFPKEIDDLGNFYFDKEENCYGSFIKNRKLVYLKLKYKDIIYVYKKIYAFKDNALELFTKDNKSYYFEFNGNPKIINEKNEYSRSESMTSNDLFAKSQIIDIEDNNQIYYNTMIRDKFFNYFCEFNPKSFVGQDIKNIRYYSKVKSDFYYDLDSIYHNFLKHLISKFEYLIRINLLSNRSYKDIHQYPIFPWILYDYDSNTKNLLNVKLRPLDIPIGIINEKLKESYEKSFNIQKDIFKKKYGDFDYNFSDFSVLQKGNININSIPTFFKNHYLNSNYVSYYMKRIFPFTIISKEIQGEILEFPERIFNNLNQTFLSSINVKGNAKELIPEFFYFPEIFRNINYLDLGTLEIKDSKTNLLKKRKIDDVILPLWCDNNPEKFISKLRELFEKNEIQINKWVNLIFGYAQKGEQALKIKNIYMPFCYQGVINLENISLEERDLYLKLFNVGVNPTQIFIKRLKEPNVSKTKIKKEKKNHLMNNNIINIIEQYINSKHFLNENDKYDEKRREKTIYDAKRLVEKLKNPNEKYIIQIYKNMIYVLYNFYSGEIFIINEWKNKNLFEIRNSEIKNLIVPSIFDNSEITAILIEKRFIFFGTRLGSIFIYNIKKNKINKIIHNHTKKICSIAYNSCLHIFIDSSEDGYINIYIQPKSIIICSIYDPLFIGDIILISYSPLPSFFVYNNEKKALRSYSINGRKLLNEDKKIEIKHPKIRRNVDFIEFLQMNDENKFIYLKLPFLEEISEEEIFK